MAQLTLFGSSTAKVVLSYGMGVDSTAILLRWLTEPATRPCDLADLVVLTAQVGDELRSTAALVEEHIFPRLRAAGVRTVQVARANEQGDLVVLDDTREPTEVKVAGAYKLSDEMLTAGTIPTSGCVRKCSLKAKGIPLDKWLKAEFAGQPFTHVIGFNADEASRRDRDASYTGDKTIARTPSYPLFDWSWGREACEAYIKSVTGVAWVKSCCSFCPFTNGKTEFLTRLASEPTAAKQALEIEARALALNPRMKLYKNKSLREKLAAVAPEAVQAHEAERAELATWALYRVRRVFQGAQVVRSLEVVSRGARAAMVAELASWGPVVVEEGAERVWLATKPANKRGLEDMLAVAPAGVAAKVNRQFAKRLAAVSSEVAA